MEINVHLYHKKHYIFYIHCQGSTFYWKNCKQIFLNIYIYTENYSIYIGKMKTIFLLFNDYNITNLKPKCGYDQAIKGFMLFQFAVLAIE